MTKYISRGYIEKKQSETDKRSFLLVPTEKAVRLVEDTYEEYYRIMSVLESGMGEKDFDELIRLLETANRILLEEKKNG